MEINEVRLFRDALRKMQRSLSGQWKNDAACCGITVAQCHALMEVGKSGEIALVELASVLGLDTSTLSRTIDSMVKSGLLERKANLEDRRYLNITLTTKGKKTYNDINHVFDRFYSDLFAGIPPQKHRQVIESINLLADAINNINTEECCREELTNE